MLQRELRVWIKEIADEQGISFEEAVLAFNSQFSVARSVIKESRDAPIESIKTIRFRFLGKFEPYIYKIKKYREKNKEENE